jgi:hypothetical protein
LIDRQVDGAVVRTGAHRDVVIGRKDNGEGGSVGRGSGSQGGEHRLAGENGSVIDRNDVGTEIFATDISNACRGGAGGNTGDVASLADVASCDLKTEGWVVTLDGLRDRVKTMEGIVGHLEVERRQLRAIGGNVTIRGQKAESLHVRGGVRKVVHTLVEASVSGRLYHGRCPLSLSHYF